MCLPDGVAWLALSKLSANLAACSAAKREVVAAVLGTGRSAAGGKPGIWLVDMGEGPSLPSLPSWKLRRWERLIGVLFLRLKGEKI